MPNTLAHPLVSVLMPAYNHAPYVRAAVESVLDQTYDNLELIAIDDASSDATWEVLESFSDARLRLYRHEANQGAHATLNEALALAKGEFIAIINSDDIYHSVRLARLVTEALQSNDKDSLVFTDVTFIDELGSTVESHPRALDYKALRERCTSLAPHIRLLTGNQAISTSNFFFSRVLAEKIGAFAPLRYTHDWDWALRASIHGGPIWVREPLLSYRVHGTNSLSEDDIWRHIHENSYIQAKALMTLELGMSEQEEPADAMRTTGLALLQNESFHPLALSLYLTCLLSGVDDHRMLALSCRRDNIWILKELAEAASIPGNLFRSVAHLAEQEICIASQTALIEEKDRGIEAQTQLINERDQYIDELRSEISDQNSRLDELYRSRLVRISIAVRRTLDRLARSGRSNL